MRCSLADTGIEIITTPPDLLRRFQTYPTQFSGVMRKTMEASLLHVQSSTPGYPRPRPNQTYIRTGTLGRTLGVSQSGGPMGKAQINTVRKLGAAYQGEYGTNLSYAPRVIGEGTQGKAFVGRWWTMKTVASRAAKGVIRLHGLAVEELARWIDGR